METGKTIGDIWMDMADSGTGEEQKSDGFRITNEEGPANDIYQCPSAETTGSLESRMMEGFKSPKTSPMLAPEIWDAIFHDVHSKDFLTVINTCPEWNHLLHSRKTTELFGQVLPFIMKWLPKKDFLNLRLASRGWKEELDDVYENHPARLASTTSDIRFPKLVHGIDGSFKPDRIVLLDDHGIMFEKFDQLQRFLRETDMNSGNPFPGRRVYLKLTDESYHGGAPVNRAELLQCFDKLITSFGEHIWYLTLWIEPRPPMNLTDMEAQLMNWLTHVPNLKRLELHLGRSIEGDASELNLNFWRQHPPQKLKNLQRLTCSTCDHHFDGYTLLIGLLLERFCANENLKRLYYPEFTFYEPQVPLPNLEELNAFFWYNDLPKLKETSPKLEKLILNLQGLGSEVYYETLCGRVFTVDTLFESFHTFADTLKELDILESDLYDNIYPSSEDFRLELPRLERLAFAYSPTNKIDILLNLSSLKYLELKTEEVPQTEEFAHEVFERMPNVNTVVLGKVHFENFEQRKARQRSMNE